MSIADTSGKVKALADRQRWFASQAHLAAMDAKRALRSGKYREAAKFCIEAGDLSDAAIALLDDIRRMAG